MLFDLRLSVYVIVLAAAVDSANLYETCQSHYDCSSIKYAECRIISPVCRQGTCTCRQGYTTDEEGVRCYKAVELNADCDPADLCTTPHSECIHGVCMCSEGYKTILLGMRVACTPVHSMQPVGGKCTSDADCFTIDAFCNMTTLRCSCPYGFIPYEGNFTCGPRRIGDSCTVGSEECWLTPNARCLNSGYCGCRKGTFKIATTLKRPYWSHSLGSYLEQSYACLEDPDLQGEGESCDHPNVIDGQYYESEETTKNPEDYFDERHYQLQRYCVPPLQCVMCSATTMKCAPPAYSNQAIPGFSFTPPSFTSRLSSAMILMFRPLLFAAIASCSSFS